MSQSSWRSILAGSPAMRRMLIVGVGTAVCQQLTGIDAIQYYLVRIMHASGIHSQVSMTRAPWMCHITYYTAHTRSCPTSV